MGNIASRTTPRQTSAGLAYDILEERAAVRDDMPHSTASGGETIASRSNGRLHFGHLDGCRAIAAIWIILEHYASVQRAADDSNLSIIYKGGHFAGFFMHGNTPVGYFITLSGFVTSYAYGGRDMTREKRIDFLIKRFSRVALSYYAAAVLGALVRPLMPPIRQSARARTSPASVAMELLMAQSVFLDFGSLNSPSWTVSSLACCWLLYPWMLQPGLKGMSPTGLIAVAALCMITIWSTAYLSTLSCVEGKQPVHWGPMRAFECQPGFCLLDQYLHVSPIARLLEFALGAACGRLLQLHSSVRTAGTSWPGAWLATCALLAVPLLAAVDWLDCAQFAGVGEAEHAEAACAHRSRQAFYSCLSPFFAIFMLASCSGARATSPPHEASVESRPSRSAWRGPVLDLLSSQVLVGLGSVSYQVYVFQEPVHIVWAHQYAAAAGNSNVIMQAGVREQQSFFAIYIVGFIISLWTFAAAFASYVEAPVMRAIVDGMKRSQLNEGAAQVIDGAVSIWTALAWVCAIGAGISNVGGAYVALLSGSLEDHADS